MVYDDYIINRVGLGSREGEEKKVHWKMKTEMS